MTQALVWLLRIGWIALLAWYAWRCRDCLVAKIPSRAALADWTILLLAPLPFSPWLEPYHAVPLLVAAVLCIAVALDGRMPHGDRLGLHRRAQPRGPRLAFLTLCFRPARLTRRALRTPHRVVVDATRERQPRNRPCESVAPHRHRPAPAIAILRSYSSR